MFRRLILLAACALAWTGFAAAQTPCGPATVIVPSGVEYAAALVPCAPFTVGLGGVRCSNCAAIEEYTPAHGPAFCVRHATQHYAVLTLRRHLVNGKCVPEIAMRRRDMAQPAPAAPAQAPPAPPPAAAPRTAPAPIAPPRAAPMPAAAPRLAPVPPAPRMAPIAPQARPVDAGRSGPQKPTKVVR